MNEAELKRKLGAEILKSGLSISQSRCKDSWDFEFIGLTTLEISATVHRKLREADFSLAVTMTQASLWGYGGGGSMALPGVCSYETIEWNHRLTYGNLLGAGVPAPQKMSCARTSKKRPGCPGFPCPCWSSSYRGEK